MKIDKNPNPCYGCRACEFVCSYHHRGVFAPEGGSIKIHKDLRTGEINLRIDSTCDLCSGEVHPLCIRYCSYGALTIS